MDKVMIVSAVIIFIGLMGHGILTGPAKPTSLDGLYIKHGLGEVARAINNLATVLNKK